jgi:hypothetical protein
MIFPDGQSAPAHDQADDGVREHALRFHLDEEG